MGMRTSLNACALCVCVFTVYMCREQQRRKKSTMLEPAIIIISITAKISNFYVGSLIRVEVAQCGNLGIFLPPLWLYVKSIVADLNIWTFYQL